MEEWASETCDVNGIQVHYLRTGNGRPTVIALHGLMGAGACWTPLARALSADFDLITPDARGHGGTSVPADGYSYGDFATDVCGLIQALDLRDPVLLGHSMGGMTAAVVASRLGTAIRATVLVDPTFISPEWQQEVFESDVFEQHRTFIATDRRALLADAQNRHPMRSAEMVQIVTDARLRTSILALDILRPPNPDYRALIVEIVRPILLVLGSRGVVSEETARELEGLNANLRHVTIVDAGHAIPYDQPDHLAACVGAFLKALPG